jgi:hypothetical protein
LWWCFFASDLSDVREEAKRQLSSVPGAPHLVGAETPVVRVGNHRKNNLLMASCVDWFLISGCNTVIAAGSLSFAMSAFFWPSSFSAALPVLKRLFAVDRIGKNGGNAVCGEVLGQDCCGFNFGFGDPQ